jgi:putative aldouronate transport system substrate-binding protein
MYLPRKSIDQKLFLRVNLGGVNLKFSKAALALSLVVSIAMTGCSKEEAKPQTTTPTNGQPTASKKEKITLVWNLEQTLAASQLPADPSKDFVKKAIDEKFNVDLKIEAAVNSPEREAKLTVKLAGGDAPALFVPGTTGGQKYITDGLTAEVNKFINEQTAPNYFKWVKQSEFKGYQLEGLTGRAPVPFARIQYASYYIRQDWLDKLGLKMPTNYNEYVNVLKAFTNNDPDGNSKKDTYGFSTAGNSRFSVEFPEWPKNGLYAGFVENNIYIDGQTDLRVAKVADDVLARMSEGVIDPDWFLNKGQSHIDKAIQGKVGVVFAGERDFAFDGNAAGLQARSKAVNPNANWMPFNPLGETPIRTGVVPGAAFQLSKQIADKNPEAIKRTVEILNWLCGEEGYLLTHYGIEGKHYSKNGKEITINKEGFEADIAKNGNFLDIYDFFAPYEPEVLGYKVIDTKLTDRDKKIEQILLSMKYYAALGSNLFPPVGVDLASWRNRMYELDGKMLFDDKSSKNWPQYREELMTKYNGQKIIDNYTKNLKEAGTIK